MSLPVPRLDDTHFERLVEDARAQIPRHAPEWTDHNLHDPGMTLIDLLAWIVDQQVYRVGFVGDRYLRAFAALLGVQPLGPEPARGLIWPTGAPVAARLAAGTRVVCVRQPDVAFALEDDIELSDAPLDSCALVRDGEETPLSLSDSLRSRASTLLAPARPGESAWLSLRFHRPLLREAREGTVTLGLAVAPLPGPPAREPRRWGPLHFEYRVGDGDFSEVAVESDSTLALARNGAVRLRVPGTTVVAESELRLRLDRGFFPLAPRLRRLALNVLPIVQHEVEQGRVITEGTGLPDQEVLFDTRDAVRPDGALGPGIRVLEPGSDVAWQEVRDFRASGPGQRHFVRRPDRLVFGNGINGRRPALGAQIVHERFERTCGTAGNLRADLSWSVPRLGHAPDGYGRNPEPITGGTNAWSRDDLVAAARDAAMKRRALLTNDELRTEALALPGLAVARAEVLSGFDVALPDRRVEGVRTLVVIPHRDAEQLPEPVSERYLEVVRSELRRGRVLGERQLVRGPGWVWVEIDLDTTVEPGTRPEDARRGIQERLRARLWDLRRSDEIDPWPLGRELSAGEIEALASGVDGVVAVTSCSVRPRGAEEGSERVLIPRDAIAMLRPDDLHLQVRVDDGGVVA